MQPPHGILGEWSPNPTAQMRFLLLEWGPWLLRMEMPKRLNNLGTIRQSWVERKRHRDEDTRTAFDYVSCPGMSRRFRREERAWHSRR